MKTVVASVLTLAALCAPASAAVLISNKATKNMSCSAGVCTPTAKNAVLNAGDLQTMLAASGVSVNTGAGAVSIAISAPLTWASASRLTLTADGGISIKAAVVVEGTGAMTIASGQANSGADLNIFPGGSIAFWDNTSSLIIGNQSFTLVSDLATLSADIAAQPNGFYAIAKDIDATGLSFPSNAAVTTALTGEVEGLGHTISHFSINATDGFSIGLFAIVDEDSVLRDLRMTGGDIECDLDNPGARVGMAVAQNYGFIKNVSTAGKIACVRGGYVGGLAGDNFAPGGIFNSTSSVTIPASKAHYAGGLVGSNTGRIQYSSASGGIAGDYAGGLVGASTGLVLESRASGDVINANGIEGGGLIGDAEGGQIFGCSASGTVVAKKAAGGLVGYGTQSLILGDSFATGPATARMAGGLIGLVGNEIQVMEVYARGAATATTKGGGSGGLIGAFSNGRSSIGDAYATGASGGSQYSAGGVGTVAAAAVTLTDLFWDLDTSGVADPSKGVGNQANFPGITGLTTTQLTSGLPGQFSPQEWSQSPTINDGYPYLTDNPPQ